MAVFNINTDCLTDSDYSSAEDIKKVKSYLYRLNDQLQYMFSNMTAEDNYSASEYQKYIENEGKIVSLETSIEGINATVKGAATQSQIRMLEDQIALKVNSSDLGNSSLTIKPAKIELATSGQLVINAGNFTIDENGNASFKGAISSGGQNGYMGSISVYDSSNELKGQWNEWGLSGEISHLYSQRWMHRSGMQSFILGFDIVSDGGSLFDYWLKFGRVMDEEGNIGRFFSVDCDGVVFGQDIELNNFSSGALSVVSRIEALEARVTALGG